MRRLMVLVVALVVGCSFGTVLALDPLNGEDAARDADGDELSNLMEFIYGANPLDPDSDGDGLPDGWVVHYDLNRAQFPSSDQYARFDTDGDGLGEVNVDPAYKFDPTNRLTAGDFPDEDGWANLREYREGTDPTNPDTDGDGWKDDCDPQPLIPTPKPGPGGGGNSGMPQGAGMARLLSASWDSFAVRGF